MRRKTMISEIGYLHHVGHVVHDIEQARKLYRRLGFLCTAPAYPMLSRKEGEPATPFGAANTHANFARNFVEIMAVVTEESHLSEDAHPIPLQVPPAALPMVIANIERTIDKISTSLARFEGLHILVFQTEDANLSAQRLDQLGVGHSGVNRVQQPHQCPMGVIEIDREDVPEGRLAVAETPVSEAPEATGTLHHPNGALDLVESLLCVPDAQLEAYVQRYQRYLGHEVRKDGAARVFDLQQSCVRLIPEDRLAELLPGETAPALAAFVAYAVAVHDLASTRKWLENNGLDVHAEPSGGIFVPARAALGAAVIFRQVV
jgi:catechol 2,3-dioxygenase-like lactoylglutathione lyase family enzyme